MLSLEFWRESLAARPEVELLFDFLAESGLESGNEPGLEFWFEFIFELVLELYLMLWLLLAMGVFGTCVCEFYF